MPASIRPCRCRNAAIVTSFAACIKASSAADLTIRQARTSSSAETTSRPLPDALVTCSTIKSRVVASTASGPSIAESRTAPAIRSNGLSSSFHVRTSPATFSVSRMEGSSKKWGDDDHFALGRDHCRGRPLGPPPMDACEILERRSRLDQQCCDPSLLHRGLHLGDASAVFLRADGRSEEHTSELQSLAYLVCR